MALRLRVGFPELRRAQLEHLAAMAELPNVTIQVIRPEDPDQVRSYTMTVENLQRVALGPDQSAALIRSMMQA